MPLQFVAQSKRIPLDNLTLTKDVKRAENRLKRQADLRSEKSYNYILATPLSFAAFATAAATASLTLGSNAAGRI